MTDGKTVDVNVEKIMEEIRRNIRMEEDMKTLPKFEDIPIGDGTGGNLPAQNTVDSPDGAFPEDKTDWALLSESTGYINRHYDIPYYWPFSGSKVKVFFKRVVRKLAKCLLAPIVSWQNLFNTHVVRCLNNLREAVLWLAPRSRAYEKEIAQLKSEVSALRGEVNDNYDLQRHSIAAFYDELTEKIDGAERTTFALRDEVNQSFESQNKTMDSLRVDTAGFIEKHMASMNELVCNFAAEQERNATEAQNSLIKENETLRSQLEHNLERIQELKGMINVNAGGIASLEKDMDCLRRLDGTIFKDVGLGYNRYSQAGEDSILAFIVGSLGYREDEVTYLDLGANHAQYLSNTYYFYQRGASGVLVEANPELIPELKLLRSRDVILNKCVSSSDGEKVDFYLLNNDGLSARDEASVAHAKSVNKEIELSGTVSVDTITVRRIFDEYFAQPPMLLNIDIEGGEMEVLNAIDFKHFRPVLIVVETIPYENDLTVGKKNDEVLSFLLEKGYVEYAFTGINSIFIDAEQLENIKRNKPHAYSREADYTRIMLTNAHAARKPQGICLDADGIVYGPYITCPAGEYSLTVTMQFPQENCHASLMVTGSEGQDVYGRMDLSSGVNHMTFALLKETERVEFVVHNNATKKVYVKQVIVKKI